MQQFNYSFGKCEFVVTDALSETNKLTNLFCPIVYVTKSMCDNKTYCWRHTRIISKKFEKDKKDKEKEAQKKLKDEAKQKEKEEKNKIKEEEKQKKLEDKKNKQKTKNGSFEEEDTNTTSPIAKPKKNKYGV